MRNSHVVRGTSARVLLALLVVVAAACGPFRRIDPSEQALLIFTNESADQTAVYAVSSGEEVRIGTVFASRTDTLVVPATMVGRGTVNVVARPLARNIQPQSGPIAVRPGVRYEIRLPSDQRSLIVLPIE